ncbi:MAG: hypothetical protein QN117_13330 [Armatimonadota bacterium]|nr:hypothetical protein [Armatimonadota bacterium]
MDVIRGLAAQWDVLLSQVSAALTVPVGALADHVELPLVTAVLFGLVGAVAPCQLTTNLSVMAYVGGRAGDGRPWREALAYVLGKVRSDRGRHLRARRDPRHPDLLDALSREDRRPLPWRSWGGIGSPRR